MKFPLFLEKVFFGQNPNNIHDFNDFFKFSIVQTNSLIYFSEIQPLYRSKQLLELFFTKKEVFNSNTKVLFQLPQTSIFSEKNTSSSDATTKHNMFQHKTTSTISIKTKRTRSLSLSLDYYDDHRPSSNRLKFGQEMPLGPLCTGKIVRQHLVNKCCLNLKSKIWTFFRQIGFLSKSA